MTSALFTPTHLAFVLVIMLLLFGAKRLPESGRALGRAMHEFKEASPDVTTSRPPPGLEYEHAGRARTQSGEKRAGHRIGTGLSRHKRRATCAELLRREKGTFGAPYGYSGLW